MTQPQSRLKSIAKWIMMGGVIILVGCGALFYLISSDLPPTIPGEKGVERAERFVDRMWSALNEPAWRTAEAATWTFRGGHRYIWYKNRGRVKAILDDHLTVYFETATRRGFAFRDGVSLKGAERTKALADATSAFNNDSFWLVAPFKARDLGTQRASISDAEGEGLLVYYTSGGTTPGDRYLWRLDEQNRPKSWDLWVQIIPIKGARFTWTDWHQTESGALISLNHSSKVVDIPLTDVRVVKHYDDLKITDPYLTLPTWSQHLE